VTSDNYQGAAAGWAGGAALVYGPIAVKLIARSPVALTDARVLDIGAGTGVSEAPLRGAGAATAIGVDLSHDMLAWERASRCPAVVGDVMQLPFPNARFDAAIASFVLNHLDDPVGCLIELVRVLRPGGAVLATVYANSSQSANRNAVDVVARAHGWNPPEWYRDLKATAAPRLGEVAPMTAAAEAAQLVDIDVTEAAVDVNVSDPAALVDYRFGQAHFADWLGDLDPDQRTRARTAAIAAIAETMEPYRPRVIFLAARTELSRR
jgi:ubiquinone/menaquinone biosynthesis C-methylase UbiE